MAFVSLSNFIYLALNKAIAEVGDNITINGDHMANMIAFRVLVFKVKSEQIVPSTNPDYPFPEEILYTVKVKRVLKGDSSGNIHPNDVIIIKTEDNAVGCGVSLRVGETYINADGLVNNNNSVITMWASSCGYVRNWGNLTKKQKREIRGTYLKNCKCPINGCHSDCDQSLPCTIVPFSSESYCYFNHAVCKSRGNKCAWRDKDRSDKKLERCLADAVPNEN